MRPPTYPVRVHERLDFLLVEVEDELVHVTHVVDDERQSFRRLVELRHNNMSTSPTNEQPNRASCFCVVQVHCTYISMSK